MSEIDVEFYAYFEDLTALEHASTGFKLIHADAFAEAHAHFASSRISLWLDASSRQWALEQFHIDGNTIEGMTISHESGEFVPAKFVEALNKLGANLVFAQTLSETGARRGCGFENGKRSPLKKVKQELFDRFPTFALKRAVDAKNAKRMRTALDRGANPNGRFENRPFIEYCASVGHYEGVRVLMKAGADVNAAGRPVIENGQPVGADGHAEAALHHLVWKAPVPLIKSLLGQDADPNLRDWYGGTPLHSAIKWRPRTDVVKLLLDAGADVSIKQRYSGTPLLSLLMRVPMYLQEDSIKRKKSRNEITKAVRMLIAAGSDLDETSTEGAPLGAYAKVLPEIERVVREAGGGEPHVPTEFYEQYDSVLFRCQMALCFSDSATLRELLESPDANKLDDFETFGLLEEAVHFGKFPMVRLLVELGANPAILVDDPESTRLCDVARTLGQIEIAEYLENKAKPFLAEEANDVDVIRRFLRGILEDACSENLTEEHPSLARRYLTDKFYKKIETVGESKLVAESLHKAFRTEFVFSELGEKKKDYHLSITVIARFAVVTLKWPGHLRELQLKKVQGRWGLSGIDVLGFEVYEQR